MATAEPSGRALRLSTPGPRPSGARDRAPGAAGPPSGQIGNRALRLGERTPAAVEKRGPYMVTRAPSIQAKLQKHRDLAKAVLRRKGMLGASPNRPDSSGKRSVKFNKGYTALSQSPDENLQVNQDVSRQLLQDGYHLDEIPDDEDLDLIPPKPMASSTCSCCWCCLGDSSSCTLQ
uniref:Family with sequence similarity 219 member B n=1 Tax=Pan troglodytes TaxID=9598 RepID=H2RII8_PANTR